MGNNQYVQPEKQGSFECVPDMSCQNRPKQYTVKDLILTQLKGTNQTEEISFQSADLENAMLLQDLRSTSNSQGLNRQFLQGNNAITNYFGFSMLSQHFWQPLLAEEIATWWINGLIQYGISHQHQIQ